MSLVSKFKKDISILRSAANGEIFLDVKNPKLFKKIRRYYQNEGVIFSEGERAHALRVLCLELGREHGALEDLARHAARERAVVLDVKGLDRRVVCAQVRGGGGRGSETRAAPLPRRCRAARCAPPRRRAALPPPAHPAA